MEIGILDIECDSLNPSVIHMIGLLDYHTDEFYDFHGDDIPDGLLLLETIGKLIVYNGLEYDIPVIERLSGGIIQLPRKNIIDALPMSRKLVKMKSHKLKVWGEMFDYPKGDHTDFSKYSPAMGKYCERDCRITKKAFEVLHELWLDTGKPNLLLG